MLKHFSGGENCFKYFKGVFESLETLETVISGNKTQRITHIDAKGRTNIGFRVLPWFRV